MERKLTWQWKEFPLSLIDYKITLMILTETFLCEMKISTTGVGSTIPSHHWF